MTALALLPSVLPLPPSILTLIPSILTLLPSGLALPSPVVFPSTVDLSPATLVGLGGALGALLRYATTRVLDAEAFPYGTLSVNVLGSFALGLLTFGGVGGDAALLFGVGACGAYTTFSSFAYDTVRLAETGDPRRGAINAVGTLLAALASVGFAWLLVG